MSEPDADHSAGDHHEPGPDLCIAMYGEYKCEGLKGHDGPHYALGGEIEWTEEFEDRQLITDGGQPSESADSDHHVPTEAESEVMGTLEGVSETGVAQCRLCHHTVEGDDFGQIFEKLAEHGEEAHDWDDATGWSP